LTIRPSVSRQGRFRSSCAAGFLKAYRWQYVHSGAAHPHFVKILTRLITTEQGERIQSALATLR
jgi:hypothetical protein